MARRGVIIASVLVMLALVGTAYADFTAYNDCVHGGSTGNVTNYSAYMADGGGFEVPSGVLKDYSTGASTGVTATLTGSNISGSMASTCNGGTPAQNTFGGIVNYGDWSASYNASSDWYYEVTFTGLDPNKAYEFVTTANRNGSSYAGSGSASRWTRFTLTGAVSFSNGSSAGALVSGNSVRINTGYNTVNGDVARWIDIRPTGTTLTIRSENVGAEGPGEPYKSYGLQCFMLKESMPTPTEVWVDDNYYAGGANDGHTWGYDAFATIQNGVNAVVAGGTVNVAAGTYRESFVINKSVTLLGAQAGVTPVSGGRTGESVITPAAGSSSAGLTIWADDVTINGFEFFNCYQAIPVEIKRALHQNVTIEYNYIHSAPGAVSVWCGIPLMHNGGMASTWQDFEISNNRFEMLSSGNKAYVHSCIGLSTGNAMCYYDNLTITDNYFKNPLGKGLFAGGDCAKWEARSPVVTGNTFDGCDQGLHAGKLKDLSLSGNDFTGCRYGLVIGTQNGTVTNNTFDGSGVSSSNSGALYLFEGSWSTWPCSGLSVTGNDISGYSAGNGVYMPAGVGPNTEVSGNTLTDCVTGIYLGSSLANDVSDNDITGTCNVGLRLVGTASSTALDIGSTDFGSSLVEFIRLDGATQDVDATGADLAGAGTDALKEAKVWHDVDDAALGHVNWGQGAATATSLTVSNVTGSVGQTVQLTAKLMAGTTPLAGQPVAFTVDSAGAGSGTTDAAGVASVNYAIATAGNKPIAASFSGVTNYKAASGTGLLTVNAAAPTSLTLTLERPVGTPVSTAVSGETVTCKVIGDNGVNYTTQCIYYAQYGAGGSWAANVYTSAKVGVWTITAVYNTLVGTAPLTVSHGLAASVAVSPTSSTVDVGGSQAYVVTATDAAGNTWNPLGVMSGGTPAGWAAGTNTYTAQAGDVGSALTMTALVDTKSAIATLNVNAAAGAGTILAWDKDTRKFYLCSNPANPQAGTEVTAAGSYPVPGGPVVVTSVVGLGGTNVSVTVGGATLRVQWYLRGTALYRAYEYSTGTLAGSKTATFDGSRTLVDGAYKTGFWGLTHQCSATPPTYGSAQQP